MHVEIHAIQRNGRSLWQVRLGRRVITFQDLQLARQFASQLHLHTPPPQHKRG